MIIGTVGSSLESYPVLPLRQCAAKPCCSNRIGRPERHTEPGRTYGVKDAQQPVRKLLQPTGCFGPLSGVTLETVLLPPHPGMQCLGRFGKHIRRVNGQGVEQLHTLT
jgi:hypothetical protein